MATVCIRIGYCLPEPVTHRQMVTWLGLDDLVGLLRRALVTRRVVHTIAFGVSDNPGRRSRKTESLQRQSQCMNRKKSTSKTFETLRNCLFSFINRQFEQPGHPETKVLRYYR